MASASTILFVAHDPGAKNHLAPLYRRAVEQGQPAEWLDLAADPAGQDEPQRFLQDRGIALVVAGSSADGAEWRWIRAAARCGARSAMMIDIGIGTAFDQARPAMAPDRFLVTNEHCIAELAQRGFATDRVHVTGSPHLEHLRTATAIRRDPAAVKRSYGIQPDRCLVPVFLPPDGIADRVLAQLHSLVAQSELKEWAMIVRPHPRDAAWPASPARRRCDSLMDVLADDACVVDTPSLLAASVCSLSFGSTVSAESWALGVPSAFFQIDWDFGPLDALYRNLDGIPRLRTAEAFAAFMNDVAGRRHGADTPGERFAGATASGWQVLCELLTEKEVRAS